MTDATGKKLLRLLEASQPGPLRQAAARVLAEVGSRDKDLADALCTCLDDPDPDLRVEVMQAVGKLRVEAALPRLMTRVSAGGPEADVAAQAAARLGAKGIRALQDLMGKTAPGLRRRIAAALAAGGTPSADLTAIESLLDADAGLVDAVARTLIGELRSLGDAQRRSVAERILELLQPKKKTPLADHSEAALVRLLAAVGDARGEAVFWDRVDVGHPTALRAEALQALGSLPPPTAALRFKKLLVCASDADFRVAAPALMILKAAPVNRKNLAEWLELLGAPDVAARRFAIEKLADQDTPELAEALLPQLKHPDRALRQDALAALARTEQGRQALAGQLLEAESAEEAWALARAQSALAKDYSAALRTKLFTRAATCLEDDDRRADALLFVLHEADANALRDRLAERALTYRKKKQYPAALHYLRLLGRDPACGEATRFELAACGLKVSAKDLSVAARAADPSLQQFARLARSHDTDPLIYLDKATWLEAEELFYLGFHFIEGQAPERDFGAGVLRLLLKKAGRSKVAKDARSKLRGAGLDP